MLEGLYNSFSNYIWGDTSSDNIKILKSNIIDYFNNVLPQIIHGSLVKEKDITPRTYCIYFIQTASWKKMEEQLKKVRSVCSLEGEQAIVDYWLSVFREIEESNQYGADWSSKKNALIEMSFRAKNALVNHISQNDINDHLKDFLKELLKNWPYLWAIKYFDHLKPNLDGLAVCIFESNKEIDYKEHTKNLAIKCIIQVRENELFSRNSIKEGQEFTKYYPHHYVLTNQTYGSASPMDILQPGMQFGVSGGYTKKTNLIADIVESAINELNTSLGKH